MAIPTEPLTDDRSAWEEERLFSEIDPLLPFRLAHEIHRDNAGFFLWTTLALVALWAGSVVDAWVSSSRSFNDPPP